MTPTTIKALPPDPLGRPSNGRDPSTNRDQGFDAVLADLMQTEGAGTVPTGTSTADTQGAGSDGQPPLASSIAAALSDAASSPITANPATAGPAAKPSLRNLLAQFAMGKLGLTTPAAGAPEPGAGTADPPTTERGSRASPTDAPAKASAAPSKQATATAPRVDAASAVEVAAASEDANPLAPGSAANNGSTTVEAVTGGLDTNATKAPPARSKQATVNAVDPASTVGVAAATQAVLSVVPQTTGGGSTEPQPADEPTPAGPAQAASPGGADRRGLQSVSGTAADGALDAPIVLVQTASQPAPSRFPRPAPARDALKPSAPASSEPHDVTHSGATVAAAAEAPAASKIQDGIAASPGTTPASSPDAPREPRAKAADANDSPGPTPLSSATDSAPAAASVTPVAAPADHGGAFASPVQAIAHAVATLADSASPAAAPTTALAETRPAPVPARSMTLQLSPAALGSVTVRLHLNGDGLDVHLSVADQKTFGLISHARDELSAAISTASQKLDSLVIQSADPSAPPSAGSHETAQSSSGGARAGQDAGSGGGGGRGTGGESMRRPSRDSEAPATRGTRSGGDREPDGLFV